MKKLLFACIFIILSASAFAQDNPYKMFGYKPKVIYKDNPLDIYKINNNDKSSPIKYLIFDRNAMTIQLLNERDSVLQIIKYNKEDILRWTAVDRYAEKYPSLSPYNYAGNNPIKNIDVNGDSIRTTGSASATAAYKRTTEESMGNLATVSQARNGNWTVSSLTDEQTLNMTPQQAEAYKGFSKMISNTNTANFSLIDGNDAMSNNIVVGDNGTAGAQSATPGTHTIDMGDIQAMGSTGILTGAGALGHEIKEGFDIQTQGLTTPAQIMGAHRAGIRFENDINGSGRFEDGQFPAAGTARIPVVTTVNGVTTQRIITITLTNGNFRTSDINNNTRP